MAFTVDFSVVISKLKTRAKCPFKMSRSSEIIAARKAAMNMVMIAEENLEVNYRNTENNTT